MTDSLDSKLLRHQAQHETRRLEIGWLGFIFGGASEKPGNIAAAAITMSFLFLGVLLMWGPDSSEFPKKEAVTLFGGVITGALGYLFGRSTGTKG